MRLKNAKCGHSRGKLYTVKIIYWTLRPSYKSSVVYKIPCSDCNLIYIGQTFQKLSDRIIQQKTTKVTKFKFGNFLINLKSIVI